MNQGITRTKSVREILIAGGFITEQQANEIESESKRSGEQFHQVVLDMKLMGREDMLKLFSSSWDAESVDLTSVTIDPEIVKVIPYQSARRYNAVPFERNENILKIAMTDPRDLFVIDDIALRTGMQVKSYFALPEDVKNILEKVYHTEELSDLDDEPEKAKQQNVSHAEFAEDARELTAELLAGLDAGTDLQFEKDRPEEQADIMQVDTSAPEVEKLVNAIILEAIRVKASDIHIEPYENRILVRYRIDGRLRRAGFKIPFSFKHALLAKIKIMTGSMNITEKRIPQDGRIQVKAKGNPIEFRVNIVPTIYGESAVMRILDRSGASAKLEHLGFLPDVMEKFLQSLAKPYGLILVCGPTGSGKSYTLSAAITAIKNPEDKILTAENPVEYNLDGVVQVQVNPDLKMGSDKVFDFSTALRSFLRQDPDIIMVGEIRDKETAQIAMEASMTGHLVLSTLHTNDAPSAISRLSEMGVHTFLVANTVECVLAQRLIGTLCGNCKEEDKNPSAELLKQLESHKIDYKNATFMKIHPGGCSKCGGRGMKGRTAIHEILVMNEDLRRFCIKEVSVGPIKEKAMSYGMRTLFQDGLVKVTMGLTTYEEIMAAAS